jgi:hypothetical protein
MCSGGHECVTVVKKNFNTMSVRTLSLSLTNNTQTHTSIGFITCTRLLGAVYP